MKTSIITIILFKLLIVTCNGQEFKTTFIAESEGVIDSVIIGFDSTATLGVDIQFGESDIIDFTFDSLFEVRTGQINYFEFICESNYQNPDDQSILYMSKVDILPRSCEGWNETHTSNGAIPFASLFIKNENLPVLLKWDSNIFQSACLNSSFITDWHPGGWWDATCGNITLQSSFLAEQDSLWIVEQSDGYTIDQNGDTISVFYIVLGIDIIHNVSEQGTQNIEIYPNPINNVINIKHDLLNLKAIKIYNSVGALMLRLEDSKQIMMSEYPNGVYYIMFETEENSYIKKVLKYGQ